MRIAYRGNFMPDHPTPFSTEAHVAWSLESLGHEVVRIQESTDDWAATLAACEGADLFLWTSTWGYAHSFDQDDARVAVKKLNDLLPTAAFHLDKFIDLPREDQLAIEPWFRLHHVFTADGSKPEVWEQHGINHHWLPPGVFHGECEPGTFDTHFASDIAFVGSWKGHYHPESVHRFQLVRHLRRQWGQQVRFWPRGPAVRGKELRDLYASVKIVVGDSCLVPNAPRYISDRVPESCGRGAFLLHPHVDGVFPELWQDGVHLQTWRAGDWSALDGLIEYYLAQDDERQTIAKQGRAHTLEHHTYARRMETLLAQVMENVAA